MECLLSLFHETTRYLTSDINRAADALGTDLEPEMPARPEGWGKT